MANARVPPLFSGETSGAVDIDECRNKSYHHNCRCAPACAICGARKHTAMHGPFYGGAPGSAPWGHVFRPLALGERVQCPASYMPKGNP
jgi:hypothetical protein